MAIKIKSLKNVIILDADKTTVNPVAEVLKILNNGYGKKEYVCVDFSGLKPSRFIGRLEELFFGLPDNEQVNYVLAVQDKAVHETENLVSQYKPFQNGARNLRCTIMNKQSATMWLNQRG